MTVCRERSRRRLQSRDQLRFDVKIEQVAVHLPVDDPHGLTDAHQVSVRTGRTMAEISLGSAVNPAADVGPNGRRPGFQKVQLATLFETAPDRDDWIPETKFDGYRCLAAVGKGEARIYTRNGNDRTHPFAALASAFDRLPCASALIDGEVMAARISGSAFSPLQNALANGAPLGVLRL